MKKEQFQIILITIYILIFFRDSIKMVMYLIVNNDLKMEKGKIASQVGHAVEEIIERILLQKVKEKYIKNYHIWKEKGRAKIILKGNKEVIEKCIEKYSEEGIYIIDEGKTQISEGSVTVFGFYPSGSSPPAITRNLKLL